MTEEFIEEIIKNAESAQQAEPEKEVEITKPIEEAKEDSIKEEVVSNKESPKPLTIEELATQIGWRPNHQGENFIDAATYILNSRKIQDTMKDHNKDLKSQLSNLKGSIDALKDHNERVYQADVRRLKSELDVLKKQKRAAVELADVAKVDELDNQIENIQKDLNTPIPKEKISEPSSNSVFDEWIKDNQWYLTDKDMATYAETVAQQYKGAPVDRIYAIVRQKVSEVFPEKFETPKSKVDPIVTQPKVDKAIGPASPVEAPKNAGITPKFTKANLTMDQINIMNQFVKSKIMTEEQYINDIAKLQEA